MTVPRAVILQLYKSLLKEANCFTTYNFRMYALRRIRDAFKENMCLTDETSIKSAVDDAVKNLAVIKRQAILSHLYKTEKLVIEQN